VLLVFEVFANETVETPVGSSIITGLRIPLSVVAGCIRGINLRMQVVIE